MTRWFLAALIAISGCGEKRREATGAEPSPPPPPAGWSEHAAEANGFAIYLPGTPTEQRVTQRNVDVDLVVAPPVDGVTYMVMTSAAGEPGKSADAALGDAMTNMVDRMRATVRWRKRVAVAGRPALEYVVEAAGNEMRGRIVIGNDRMYIVSAVSAIGTARGANDTAFFDSFRLLR